MAKDSSSGRLENAWIRSTNVVKGGINKVTGRTIFHYKLVPERDLTAAQVYKKLDKEIGFTEVKGLIEELDQTEKKTVSLGSVKAEVEQIYFRLGPYTNQDLLDFELKLFIHGTTHFDDEKIGDRIDFDYINGIKEENKKIEEKNKKLKEKGKPEEKRKDFYMGGFKNPRAEEFEIKIEKIPEIDPIKVFIPLPASIDIHYPERYNHELPTYGINTIKGSKHELATYGSRKIEDWKRLYERILTEEIIPPLTKSLYGYYGKSFEKAEKKLEEKCKLEIEKAKAKKDFKIIEEEKIREREEAKADLKEKRNQIKTNINDNLAIVFKSYNLTIQSILSKYASKKELAYESFLKDELLPLFARLSKIKNSELPDLEPQKVKHKHTYKIIKVTRFVYDEINKISRLEFFKDKYKGFGIEGEIEPGLDENGWPLEVSATVNVNRKHEVLLDGWIKGRGKPREVPPEWVGDCDLLDIVCWIFNLWDEYRDDLRDGRYHPGSLTAIDYAMAVNPTVWGEWETKRFNLEESKKFQKYVMKNKDGTKIEDKRKPSNLSPAFDMRAIKKINDWKHCGKKRYYGLLSHLEAVCDEEYNDERMISTRGVCLYFVERVTREMKDINQARVVLKKIGNSINWFDYGPRKFNTDGPQDPFDIPIEGLNKEPEPSKVPSYITKTADAMEKGKFG